MKQIVGIGELLWDMLPAGKQIGGAPGNFAFHAGQCGAESTLVSAVGQDDLGKELLAVAKSKNLNAQVEVLTQPTGTVDVELDENGIPSYTIVESVAWDYIPYTKSLEDLAHATDAVCFGSLAQRNQVSRNTIYRFLDAMKPDALKIFDINLRQHFYTKEIIEESLERTNILKLNDEEVEVLKDLLQIDKTDVDDVCHYLMDKYGLSIVILTCGINGSRIYSEDVVSCLPTPKVEVADTVGAGDAFTAAFCTSFLQNHNIKIAHQKAVEVSAYVCTQNGAMPTLPNTLLEM